MQGSTSIKTQEIVKKRFYALIHISGIKDFHTFASLHSFASSCKDDCDGNITEGGVGRGWGRGGGAVMQEREC